MYKEKLNKNNKGITLIALIITIIVMLILVGVTVTVALDGGLFESAQTAVDKTELAKRGEKVTGESLTQYYVDRANGTIPSTQTLEQYILSKYNLEIGDKVDYQEGTSGSYTTPTDKGIYASEILSSGTYKVGATNREIEAGDLSWVVLGVNSSGHIELVSEELTDNSLYLKGIQGYINSEEELNNFCNSIYGKGKGATGARSLNADDVNKIENYNPNSDTSYGIKYTYQYSPTDTYVKGIKSSLYETNKNDLSNNNWGNIAPNSLETPYWKISSASSEQGPEEMQSTHYSYDVSNDNGITFKYNNTPYWLSSKYVLCNEYNIEFGLRQVNSGGMLLRNCTK